MKKILFKVVLPLMLIGLWMILWYPICKTENGFDFFLYWVLVGFPFGMRKMCMVLIPKNFGISGSVGVLALNVIVGGLIGGIVVVIHLACVIKDCIFLYK